MTIDVTLANVGNLIDTTTAQTTINNNNAAIVTAFDSALDTSGDQMEGNLDMNSNRILNLPAPISNLEPARLVDLEVLTGSGTITVNPTPTGGTVGQVLAKNSSSNYDYSWKTEVPLGGTTGQALVKNSNTDLDNTWSSLLSYPGTATDKALVRFNGSTNTLQNSTVTLSDAGILSGGSAGIPIVGRTTNAVPTAGQVGEYIATVVGVGAGPTIISGSGGQIWASITLTPGMWLVGAQTGVFQSSGSPVFTHMHGGYGVAITNIPSSPGNGVVTAAHITSNNPNGWIFPNGPTPLYLSTTSTINAVATADLTGGTATFYGTLWAMRFA